jgi:hypothetical protein
MWKPQHLAFLAGLCTCLLTAFVSCADPVSLHDIGAGCGKDALVPGLDCTTETVVTPTEQGVSYTINISDQSTGQGLLFTLRTTGSAGM